MAPRISFVSANQDRGQGNMAAQRLIDHISSVFEPALFALSAEQLTDFDGHFRQRGQRKG
jgi:hypothetical protein